MRAQRSKSLLVALVSVVLMSCGRPNKELNPRDVSLWQNGKPVSEWVAVGEIVHSEGVFRFHDCATGQEVQVSGDVVIEAGDSSMKPGDCK